MDAKKTFKDLVSRLNKQLWYYERDWVSVQRYPDAEKVRPQSLEEYLEARFNFEAYKVPELQEIILETEGRLFSCTELEGPDEIKRRYKQATMKLINVDDIPDDFSELKEKIIHLEEELGGNTIKFNSVKRKIKIVIDNE